MPIIDVNSEKFKNLIDNFKKDDYIIIDVRTPMEYNSGHISGAINIDYYSSDIFSQIKSLDRNKTYLIYCRSGHRSAEVSKIMEEEGFKQIYNLKNGLLDWPYNLDKR